MSEELKMVLTDTPEFQPICRPQRPRYGTLGHSCVVVSNHFGVNVLGSLDFYHNEPDKVWQLRRPGEALALVRISSGARDADHEESCSTQETEKNLNLGLPSIISLDDISKGRSLYLPGHECGVIGNGVEYRKGFYVCSRPTQMGLSLIIDSLTETLYEPVLVSDFVFAYLGKSDISTPLHIIDQMKITRTLKGVKIRHTLMKNERNHVILDLSTLPLNQLTFLHEDTGEMTTVAQYYHEKYKINLKYPFFPALQVGNESNPVYFPMELSGIVAGQKYTNKLNEKQRDAFSKKSCDHPNSIKKSILKILKGIIAKDLKPHLYTPFTPIVARVLPPPTLEYLGAQEIPKMGVWNMMDKKFVRGATVERWTCLSFSQVPLDTLTRFCVDLVNMCRDRGMEINPVPYIPIRCAQSDEIEEELHSIQREPNIEHANIDGALKFVEFLIIILPEVNVGSSYARIKSDCDRKVISQCCEFDRVYRYTDEILANMASKINVKAGGRNISIKYAMVTTIPLVTHIPTIIFGGHVNHPDPHDLSSSSIAGVVASMDWPDVTTYGALMSAQSCKDETINGLHESYSDSCGKNSGRGMIRKLLVAFYNKTGRKPSRIIFYRDAVSNGQITEVLQKEIMAIRKACLSLQCNYLPRITYVVVQRTHHTRIFPWNSPDKSENILPGTIVESQICHPSEFDFYLCSHAAIQGTIRPAHYHVLQDENQFTPDDLQSLTNILCYTYAIGTRTVSIVAPVKHAQLVASRGRCYIRVESLEAEATCIECSIETMSWRMEMVHRLLPKLNNYMQARMFYV